MQLVPATIRATPKKWARVDELIPVIVNVLFGFAKTPQKSDEDAAQTRSHQRYAEPARIPADPELSNR